MAINPDELHRDVSLPGNIYFSQVTFDGKQLNDELNKAANNGEFIVWSFNARQAFMMEKDSFRESRWFIPFNEICDETGLSILQFNFGDLLKLPNRVILTWEKFFIGVEIQLDDVKRLLFPKTDNDVRFVQEYWERKTKEWQQTDRAPWFTEDDEQYPPPEYNAEKKEWLGAKSLKFRKEVLDKYEEDPLCRVEIHNGMHSSLELLNNNEKAIRIVWFWMENDEITVDAKWFINLPYKERQHWEKHRLT